MNATKGIIGLLLAATLLCACGKRAGSSPGGEESGNISGSASPGTGAPGQPRLLTPVPGLRDVRPIRWTKVTAEPDSRSLTVAFWSEPCIDVDHVRLAEEPGRVVVTLYVGTSPSEENQPCAQTAEYLGVKVPLSSPLRSRRVVDGTSGVSQEPTGPGTSVSPSQP
ncbi:MAG TPA: hypothetical protein VIV12_09005 [Streptosporangiaceae bacterium]